MATTSLLARMSALIAIGLTLSCAGQPAGGSAPAPSPPPSSTAAAGAVASSAPPTASVAPAASVAPTPTTPPSLAALASEQRSTFLREFQTASAPMLEAGNYLGIVELLEQERQKPVFDDSLKVLMRQLAGTYASFVGQYQEALEDFAPARRDAEPLDTLALNRMTDEDAIDAIAGLATNRQAVFVNEAHYMPRDRALTANLLPKLRALGFSYLAVETLADADTGLNARGYPVHTTGFYSNEPVFGEMLRIAHTLGFKLVPYEAATTNPDEHEQGQAKNLVERILRADPKAKIVVHAGFDHINESGTLAGAKPMAIRFRELTGIDPLTVDQTAMTEQADTTYEDPRYRFLMKHVRRRSPFVLKTGDAVWTARPGVHDVTVISPRAVHRGGRPSWIWTMGGNVRRAYIASDEACPGALDCVITARRAGEREDAIPVDVLRVQFSAPGSKTFALPPGRYLIEARDAHGAPLSRQMITITPGR